MSSQPPPAPRSSEQIATQLAFWLVLFGVPTLVLNRAIIPALPGSRSGIEQLLDRSLAIGSISSQLLALLTTLLLIRLVASGIGAATAGVVERLFVLPIGSAVGFIVVAASAGTLDPELHLLLAAIAAIGLFVCARPALRHPSTRAGGVLLVIILAASVCLIGGRLMALRASMEAVPRHYTLARVLATAGRLFDLLALLWVITWTIVTTKTRGVVRIALVATATIAAVVLAHLGRRADPTFVQVVASRAFAALVREPAAFGSIDLVGMSDVMAMLLGLALLSLPGHQTMGLRRAMALLLLGRCSLDIPALAGIATAGGLLLAWVAPYRTSRAATRAKHADSTPDGDAPPSDLVQVAAETTSAP